MIRTLAVRGDGGARDDIGERIAERDAEQGDDQRIARPLDVERDVDLRGLADLDVALRSGPMVCSRSSAVRKLLMV